MIKHYQIILLAGLCCSSPGFGEESGKLPRPQPKKLDPVEAAKKRYQESQSADKSIAPVVASPAESSPADEPPVNKPPPAVANQPKLDLEKNLKTSYCHSYLSTPFAPLVYVDLLRVYLMSRQQKIKTGLFRYNLVELDFSVANGNIDVTRGIPANRVFSLNGPKDLVVLPHGAPPTGFTALSLVRDKDGCGRGQGAGVTIPVRSTGTEMKKPARTMDDDYYSMVNSLGGRLFAVYGKKQLRSLDPLSLQSRAIFTFDEGQIPLYWDPDRKHLYAWNVRPFNQIVRMVGSSQNIIGRIKLKPGEKLVQDREKFGLMKLNVAKNSISVAEVKGWSGVERSASYTVSMPVANPVSDASVVPDFERRMLLVYGGTPRSKEVWTSVFLFSYERRTLLAKLNVKPDEYVDSAVFSPDKNSVLVVIADKSSDLHTGLKVFDINKRAWIDLGLD